MKMAALVLIGLSVSAAAASAQQTTAGCPAPRSLGAMPDSMKPDIAIIARVQAAELKFNTAPSTSLQLSG